MLASLGLTALQVLGSTGDEEIDTSPGGLLVMFTDLEGFTSFTSTEGDDAARRLLAEHHQRVTPIIRARGGRVVKRLGDGLLLTFPTAESGVLAGLDLLPTAPSPLRLRAGAHHGDVVASKGDVIGHVVNVAARVTDRTPGGQLFVTEAVREEAGDLDGVLFGRLRRLRLKGIDDRVPVRRVEDRRAATPALRPG